MEIQCCVIIKPRRFDAHGHLDQCCSVFIFCHGFHTIFYVPQQYYGHRVDIEDTWNEQINPTL